ncbi:MAG: hypothetical protein ACE5KC_03945, partial [Candidatus Bathyarchaeia archaeon]
RQGKRRDPKFSKKHLVAQRNQPPIANIHMKKLFFNPSHVTSTVYAVRGITTVKLGKIFMLRA